MGGCTGIFFDVFGVSRIAIDFRSCLLSQSSDPTTTASAARREDGRLWRDHALVICVWDAVRRGSRDDRRSGRKMLRILRVLRVLSILVVLVVVAVGRIITSANGPPVRDHGDWKRALL